MADEAEAAGTGMAGTGATGTGETGTGATGTGTPEAKTVLLSLPGNLFQGRGGV